MKKIMGFVFLAMILFVFFGCHTGGNSLLIDSIAGNVVVECKIVDTTGKFTL